MKLIVIYNDGSADDGNYKCSFKQITKSIVNKLGLDVDVSI